MSEEQRPVADATGRPPQPGVALPGRLGLAARRRDGMAGLFLGLLIALAMHALMVPAVGALAKRERDPSTRRKSAQLIQLSRAQGEKNRRIELEVRTPPREETKKEEESKEEEDETDAPGQVVSLPPPDKEQRPDVADHAAEHDQRVDHETRSRDQQQRPAAVARRLEEGRLGLERSLPDTRRAEASSSTASEGSGPAGPGRATAGDSGSDEADGQGERMFALEIPKQAAREPLRLERSEQGVLENSEAVPEVPGNGDTARVALGNKPSDSARRQGSGGTGSDSGQGLLGGGNDTPGLPSLEQLTPTPQELARIAGAPANDFLPEVEVDAETRLNAWRWKHATFFNRIADAIRREWQGGEVLTSNDPAGRVFGFEDRMTVLQVTLDKSGNVIDVNVAEPSGAVVLDDEAVRAFKEAGPFSNPPEQLFKGRDRFTFLFGFNVSYNRSNFDLNWRPY